MKKILFLLSALFAAALPAQEALKGSLSFADGTPGRVSYIDMAIKQ